MRTYAAALTPLPPCTQCVGIGLDPPPPPPSVRTYFMDDPFVTAWTCNDVFCLLCRRFIIELRTSLICTRMICIVFRSVKDVVAAWTCNDVFCLLCRRFIIELRTSLICTRMICIVFRSVKDVVAAWTCDPFFALMFILACYH